MLATVLVEVAMVEKMEDAGCVLQLRKLFGGELEVQNHAENIELCSKLL